MTKLQPVPSPLVDYYKSFKSIWGALAAFVGALPWLSKFLPAGTSHYVFPPLGQIEPLARTGAIVFALLATYVAFFLGSARAKRNAVIAACTALLCFVAFLVFYSQLVRTVDISSQGVALSVSVGFERSDFAKQTFANASDEEMLRARSMSDEEIRKLWTPWSVIAGRLALWISCVGVVCALVLALSFGVLSQIPPHEL